MTGWRETTLGQICAEGGGFIRTGPFGSQLHQSDYTDDPNGIPVVMPKDMAGGRVSLTSIARIDEATADRLSQHLLAAGDVALSRRGDVGRSAWIATDDLPVLCGTGSMRVHPGGSSSVSAGYLRYFFRSRLAIDFLEGQAVGATMPNLNAGIVTAMPVPVLPRALQEFAASVLSTIDDLIENNRRRVEVLEEMARAIYREWFVRFRYPGHEDVALVDSPLGPIPDGWPVGTVSDVVETLTRGIAPKYAEDGPSIVLNQKCIRDQRVSLAPARRQERKVPPVKQVRFGDALVNSTGVGTLGRVAVFLEEHPALTADSHVTIVRPVGPDANPWFGLNLTGRQQELEALGTGSTGQTELSRSDIGALALVIPSAQVRQAFADVVWPTLKVVPALLRQSRQLAAIRDLLLPKLVTGQIDVAALDLEALVEGSVA